MPGSFPSFWAHNDCPAHADHIVSLLHEFFPPQSAKIVEKFVPQMAKIPTVGQSSVNLRTGKNKPPALAQRNNFIHQVVIIFSHTFYSTTFPEPGKSTKSLLVTSPTLTKISCLVKPSCPSKKVFLIKSAGCPILLSEGVKETMTQP